METNIPEELRPVIQAIAVRFYSNMGYTVSDDYNFSKSQHPTERMVYQSAINALGILEEFCLDNWGTDLSFLIDED
ncbi:MAG: hypothetical protein LRZ84_14285 [Desertifilum sp.]|nr:hypothetical protein [Desertifilum sp.]